MDSRSRVNNSHHQYRPTWDIVYLISRPSRAPGTFPAAPPPGAGLEGRWGPAQALSSRTGCAARTGHAPRLARMSGGPSGSKPGIRPGGEAPSTVSVAASPLTPSWPRCLPAGGCQGSVAYAVRLSPGRILDASPRVEGLVQVRPAGPAGSSRAHHTDTFLSLRLW